MKLYFFKPPLPSSEPVQFSRYILFPLKLMNFVLLLSILIVTVVCDENFTTTTEFMRQNFVKNDEARLIEDLLSTYKARGAGLARPVKDSNTRLTVSVKFIINEFEGIQDVTKRMRLAGILKLTWRDIYLGKPPPSEG